MECKFCKTQILVKGKWFCSEQCKKEYHNTPEYKLIKRQAALKQWEGNTQRKSKLSKSTKKRFQDNPELRDTARNNLKAYNDLHKGKGNGIPHTEDHKKYISEKLDGIKRSKETKKKIKTNHWATTEQRQEVIEKMSLRFGGESWELAKQKMSETRSQLMAEGLLNTKTKGKTGYYISKKTKQKEYFQSTYELYRMIQLDQDVDVIHWTKKHGIAISFISEKKTKKYIPDFYIIKTGCKILEEVKSPWTDKNEIYKQEKHQAAVTYCTEQGLKFEWNILRIGYKEIKELPL